MAKTGYKIIVYIDVNPQSPTFQTERTERVSSEECSSSSANWAVVSQYCETDENGLNTGYLVSREMDISEGSSTYGEIRETKTIDAENCEVQGSDPEWHEDEKQSYCETKIYEPSHLEGYTGYKMKLMIDENKYSPTHNQQKWVKELSTDCPAPNTEPQIEAISESCVLVECSGKTTTNGYKTVYGIDKNPYSSTYLSSSSEIVADEEHCPNNCSGSPEPTYVFTFQDGTTSKSDNVQYGSEQKSYTIISTIDGNPCDFTIDKSCDWISTTKTSTSLNVGISENTGASRSCTITLTQNGSNNTIQLVIEQAQVPSYVFTWNDGTTAQKDTSVSYNGGNVIFDVVSTLNDAFQDYTIASSPSDIASVVKDGGKVTFSITSNTGSSRTVTVTLTQNGSGKQLVFSVTQPQKIVPTFCDFGALQDVDFFSWNDGYYNAEKTYEFTSNCNWEISKPSGLDGWLDLKVKPMGGEYSTTLTGTDSTTYVLYMKPKLTSEPSAVYTHTVTASCSCGSETKEIELTVGAQLIGVYNNKISNFKISHVNFHFTDGTTYLLPLNASGMGDYWTNVYKYWDASMLGKVVERAYGVYNGVEKYLLVLQYGKTLSNGGMMGMNTKVSLDNEFRFEETDEDTLRQNFDASGFSEIHAFIYSNISGEMSDFTYSSDASWFQVLNVEKKTANKYYDVSTRVLENTSSDERVGTITFNQTGTNNKLYIIATQRGKKCTPSTSTCYQISNSAMTHTVVAATDTENELTWDYTAVTTTINELCEETVTTESGSSSSTISFSENTGDSDKTISGYVILDKQVCGGDNIINYSFTQRGAKKYTFCYKDSSTVKSLSLAWDEEQSEIQVYSYWHIDTSSTVNLSFSLEGEQPDWCQVVTTSDYIKIIPNEQNTGTTNYSSSLTFVQNESGKKITLNVSQTYKDYIPSDTVIIEFLSTYSEIVNISRFRIMFNGSSNYTYVNVNSGPIYQGSMSSVAIKYSSTKPMVSMSAAFSDGSLHTVALPGSSVSGTPKLRFSSQYLRGGTRQTLTIGS